jgi:hypothetical protein
MLWVLLEHFCVFLIFDEDMQIRPILTNKSIDNLLLWNHSAKFYPDLAGMVYKGPISKSYPAAPTSIQDGHSY